MDNNAVNNNTPQRKVMFKKRQGIFNPKEKVPLKLTSDVLTSILSYVLSDDRLITRGNLSNTKKLFNLMDLSLYDNDIYNEAKIHYIRQVLIAKLELYMTNRSLILDFAYSAKYKDIVKDIMYDIDTYKLASPDIKYITSMITDRLNYCFLYVYKDYVMDQFLKLETNDFVHLKDLKDKLLDVIVKLISDIRRAENLEKSNMDFSLDAETFEAIVTKTVEELQNPSCNLKCGMRSLNEMIGGHFEAGRFYLGVGCVITIAHIKLI